MSVKILYQNCAGCKQCHIHCPNDVIGWDAGKGRPYIAYPDECSHCGVCALECKFEAIHHTIPLACYDDLSTFTAPVNSPHVFDWRKWL